MQNKRFKKKSSPLIVILILILIIIIAVAIIFLNNNKENNYDENSLIGTFLYEADNTKYEFNENGTGSMSSDSYKFDYNYKVEENSLQIDFTDDKVHDVTYKFELKGGTLKLISSEGTVSIGEEYILKRVNK